MNYQDLRNKYINWRYRKVLKEVNAYKWVPPLETALETALEGEFDYIMFLYNCLNGDNTIDVVKTPKEGAI
jgi:hypothetical protein